MRLRRHFASATALALLAPAVLLAGCGDPGKVTISTTAFDFGSVAVNTRITRIVVTVSNSTTQPVTLAPALSGTIEGAISRGGSCEKTVAAGAACSIVLTFAPSTAGPEAGALALNLKGNRLPDTQSVALAGTAIVLQPGESLVTGTNNPLVALYSYHPLAEGSVWIDFGTTASYGLKTSTHTMLSAGETVSLYVAGMRANTLYHMRASVLLDDGTVLTDSDHTFTTSNFSQDKLPNISAAATGTGTPQPGVELMAADIGPNSTYLQAFATDLSGNLIWGYDYPDRTSQTIIQPIKMLPNGHFIVVASYGSQELLDGVPTGQLVDAREIDLAGNPIRDITIDQLNTRLAAAGFDLTVYDMHHDVLILPNGHWILITNTIRNIPATGNVVGDVIIDLDNNLQPVWVWNTFDHLDINRRPSSFPDWTHSNGLLYSPNDGALLLSMRHQNWIIKIDYADGTGTGDVLWRLGEGGDFTLTNGADPVDWFYGQHQPSFVGTATSGVFSLTVMDNGFNREVASNLNCGASNTPCYTTVPVLSIDEGAKTATITFRNTLPTTNYSYWGGGTTALANGNLEFDLCAQGDGSEVDEITVGGQDSFQSIWQLKSATTNLYRSNRLSSLYPGVQW